MTVPNILDHHAHQIWAPNIQLVVFAGMCNDIFSTNRLSCHSHFKYICPVCRLRAGVKINNCSYYGGRVNKWVDQLALGLTTLLSLWAWAIKVLISSAMPMKTIRSFASGGGVAFSIPHTKTITSTRAINSSIFTLHYRRDSVFIDVAGDSGVDQSEEGKVPEVPARPAGIPGVSPKHLTVDAQTVADTGSSEDIDSSSDDQVNVDVSCVV